MDIDTMDATKEQTVKLQSRAEFNSWLAGFIDGEGCFSIFQRKRDLGYFCRFTLQLRDDDSQILKEIVDRTGIGYVCYRSRDRSAVWEVAGKDNCWQLVRLLEKFPLRAKKQRDFKIWKTAVGAWKNIESIYLKDAENGRFSANRVRADWSIIGQCKDELTQTKQYVKVENNGN